jgi:oligo-1,6-glucosidase
MFFFAAIFLGTACAASCAQTPNDKLMNGYQPTWWKEAVVYQIYPRSFQDTNGDGIGDLNGITEHLDYLKKLGVNVIWLSPHYDSPNADNGYDIRDYRKVMREFGTMEDFDRMLAAIKARKMRLIIDLVVNHSSDEHHWFAESRKSKTNPYRDYYIWRDGRPNPADPERPLPPNNYPSFFSGSAWQWDETTKQFYLHYFAVKQPDLNWENKNVRDEVYGLMKFWLDKGVDGFRMDVIPLISKQPGLPDLVPGTDFVKLWANGPRRDEFLQEMNREVLSKYDVMTVGEAIGIDLEHESEIVNAKRHELNMIFNFDAIRLNRAGHGVEVPFELPKLKAIYDSHAKVLGKEDWDTVFLANHDNPRVVSNFGDTSTEEFRKRSAKLLETMILTLRGTAYIYQGDELGMTNYPFKKLADFDDIEVKNAYKALVETGKQTEAEFIAQRARFGRDNSRTPMQWSDKPNAGFTTAAAKPWLPVNPNYTTINAAAEVKDADSIYNYVRKMIALRAAHKSFVYGDYVDLAPEDAHVYAYTRTLGNERFLVVLNWGEQASEFKVPEGVKAGKLMLGNVKGAGEEGAATLHLSGWEARVYSY